MSPVVVAAAVVGGRLVGLVVHRRHLAGELAARFEFAAPARIDVHARHRVHALLHGSRRRQAAFLALALRFPAIFRIVGLALGLQLVGLLALALGVAFGLGADVVGNHVLLDLLDRFRPAGARRSRNLRAAVRLAALVHLGLRGQRDAEKEHEGGAGDVHVRFIAHSGEKEEGDGHFDAWRSGPNVAILSASSSVRQRRVKMGGKWVYAFSEGDGRNKQLLGGKGANLCEMTRIGLNVPPGFVITTEACLACLATPERHLPDGVMAQVREHMAALEAATGRIFGGRDKPLLVSVRSGSAMSMPGMMDTILNLGLNAETLHGLIAQTGNPRFAYDAYRRFIQLFGKVALGVPDEPSTPNSRRPGSRPGSGTTSACRPPTSPPSPNASWPWCRKRPAGLSRLTRTNSSKSPSRRYSTRGWASARSTTGASSISRQRWPTARRSMW